MQGTTFHFAKIYLIDFADGDLVTNFLAGFLQLLDHFAFSLLQFVITLIGNICVVGSAAFPNFGSNYLMPNSRGLQILPLKIAKAFRALPFALLKRYFSRKFQE